MIPTLKLGPWESPAIEIPPSEINQVLALLLAVYAPLEGDMRDSLWSFLQLDTITLDERTESFFVGFERVCERIASSDLLEYSVAQVEASEFRGYFKGGVGDGTLTSATRSSARQFLGFLASHSDHWPLGTSA